MLDHGLLRLCFGGALLSVVFLAWANRQGGNSRKLNNDRFASFQRVYLIVYLSAMMADWLQGPYVYALYESYGFTRSDNAILFTAGFGSSAIFGTFIGSLADHMGRRRFAALYCVLYGVSCSTKHMADFSYLMFGRITGGIATSLLFSVFEAWLVSEHNRRNFDPDLLGGTFSNAVFFNGIVAIMAGEVGQMAADMKELTPWSALGGAAHYGGYCAPFDVAILFLVFCLVVMLMLWPENYGQHNSSTRQTGTFDAFKTALNIVYTRSEVLSCGLVCSLFEASMFIFVFMWTPAVTVENEPKPPYGHIFASFMIMSMLGSQLFSLASKRTSIENIGQMTLILASICHAVPVLTSDVVSRFFSFLVFEMCVGLYFPMMSTLKSKVVPEEARSAIYNIYRLPLNIIVVGALVADIDLRPAFMLTTTLLIVACVFHSRIKSDAHRGSVYHVVGSAPNADVEFGLDEDVSLDMCGDTAMETVIGAKQ